MVLQMKAEPSGEWTDLDAYRREYGDLPPNEEIADLYGTFLAKAQEKNPRSGFFIGNDGSGDDVLYSKEKNSKGTKTVFHGYIRNKPPEEVVPSAAERLVGDPPTLLKKPRAPPHRPKSKPKPYFFSPYAYQ